jgi:Cu(I)/Ag(I) efflux system membrane fusion protein
MKLASLSLTFAAAAALLCSTAGCAPDSPALKEPAKSVMSNYLAIQASLAGDTIQGLDEHAKAIATAVQGDSTKTLPPDIAAQAETLAQAKDIKAARAAFKPLSASLIAYIGHEKAAKGLYHEVYCPMAEASWLQTGKDIRNPYYGKEMLDCGELKN